MRKTLAVLLTGIMVLSVVAVPGVAQTTTAEATATADASSVAGVNSVTPHESANHSLSIPGRSYAEAAELGTPGNAENVTGNFAIEFWVRYNESSAEDAVVMTKGGIPGNRNGNHRVTLDGTGDARTVTFAFNGFAGSLTSNSEIPAQQWTHVAFTYDGSTQTLYLNGEQDAQRSENSNPNGNQADVHFGTDDSEGGHFLDGRIDDVRVWSDSRNLIEVQDNMLSELAGDEQGLQTLYQFDETGLNDGAGSADLTTGGDAKLVDPDANLGGYAPPFLHATPANDSVVLNWTARTAGPVSGPTPTEYWVYRSTSPGFTSNNVIATVSGSQTSYVDNETVEAGTTYYYQIRAYDGDNAAGYSKSTVARPYVERGGGSFDVDGRGYGTVSDRPSLELGNRGDFAAEFWLKFNESSDEDAVVFTKGGIPGQRSGAYTAYLQGAGEARQITFNPGGFAGSLTSNTEIQAGQWTHVAFTYDGSTQTLFLNGRQDAQRSENSNPPRNSAPLRVGVDDSEGGHFLNGSVDDLRLWEDGRDRAEIRANFRNRLTGEESGLLNYWRFNEIGTSSGDTVRSSETKKSNMSLNGDAAVQAGGAYPVAPYVFATSENAASILTHQNRMGAPMDAVHYQYTTGDAPSAGAGTFYAPENFTSREVSGLSNGETYYHYLQSEVDGQRSDFQRAATSTPYADRGGTSLSVEDGSYGTATDRPTLNLNGEFTLSFWVKYSPSSDEDAVVLSKGGTPSDTNGNYMAYLVGSGEDRQVQFTFNGFHNNFRSNGGIPANVWTHVAYTYDGSTRTIYINGQLDAQGGEDSSPNGVGAPLRIGTDQPATGHYLDGNVDEVKIWNDTRTDQEIQNTFVNPFLGNESGLEHYWRFDDAGKSEARGSASWHATVDLEEGAALAEPGVIPVPPRTYARGENGQAEVVWRVRNRPDEVSIYRSSMRDRSDRTLVSTGDADRQSVFVDRGVTNGQTAFYEATSTDDDGQESDYAFPASALPSRYTAGNAWEFNGQSSYVTVEDRPALDLNGEFTMSFWVKYNETSDEDAVVLSKGGTPGSGSGNYHAYLEGTGANRTIWFGFNGFLDGIGSNTQIRAGEWTHVAVTHDGSTQSLYLDGELDAQQSDSRNPNGVDAPLRIGTNQPATGNYLDGQVDEVRILKGVSQTDQQIADNYDNELVGDEVGFEGYWRGCYSQDTQTVWGHARKPMTATFTDVNCVQSTVWLRDSETSTFNVTLDGGTNGLGSYQISVETGADTAIRSVEPGILGGDRFDLVEGGPGAANLTVSASEETGIVGPSDETRTLFTVEYSGNLTRDDLTLTVDQLSDDNFDSIPTSAVSIVKTDAAADAPEGDDVPVSVDAPSSVAPGGQVTINVSGSGTGVLSVDGEVRGWVVNQTSPATISTFPNPSQTPYVSRRGDTWGHVYSSLGDHSFEVTATAPQTAGTYTFTAVARNGSMVGTQEFTINVTAGGGGTGPDVPGVSDELAAAVAGSDGTIERQDILDMVQGYLTTGSVDGVSITRSDVLALVQYYLVN
jgi:hypothetical protein